MLDGVHHVGKEAGVAVAVDIGGSLLQALVFLVVGGLMGEVPHINIIGRGAAKLHGAGLTEQVKSLLQILGVDVGGALDPL